MMISDNDLNSLSESQLRDIVAKAHSILLQRAVEEEDPDVLVGIAMEKLFTLGGEPKEPYFVTDTIIGIPGMVRDGRGEKHDCVLFTVQLPDGGAPTWLWEDSLPTYIHSDSAKIGGIRRTAALHMAIDDLEIARHDMSWDGERHIRKSSRAWTVQRDPEDNDKMVLVPVKSYTPTHLPPPQGEVDSRSYSGRN